MKKIISLVVVLLLMSSLSIVSFAAGSPLAPIHKDYEGGNIEIITDTNTGEVTFKATAKDGYEFAGWEIEGDYEIVSGSLDSETVTVLFLDGTTAANVVYKPLFEKIENPVDDPTEPTTAEETTTEPDDDDVSPKTGDSSALVLLAVAALGGVIVSKKKLSK